MSGDVADREMKVSLQYESSLCSQAHHAFLRETGKQSAKMMVLQADLLTP